MNCCEEFFIREPFFESSLISKTDPLSTMQCLEVLNKCNRLSYKMFESRRCQEVGHHTYHTRFLEIANFEFHV